MRRSAAQLPPLVPGWPLLGNALELAADPIQFWVSAARKHGPAYRVRYPTAPGGEMFVMAGLKANEFATRHGHEVFTTRQYYEKLTRETGTKNYICALDGDLHTFYRKVVKPALSREATAPFVQDMIRTVEQRVCGSMLYALLKQESLFNRVRHEIDKGYGRGTPGLQQLHSMTTLRNCVKETLRIYTIAPAVPRYAARTFEFEGYTIPEGSYVFIAVVAPHFDDRYFTNAETFDPDRFAQPRSEGARPYAFAPFGLGLHACPSAGLVETIVLATMCGLIRRLDFEFDPPGYKLRSKVDPVPGPERGFRLKIYPRNLSAFSVSASVETELEAALPGLNLNVNPEELKRFADGVVRKSFAPGAVIIRQGDAADEFFVVAEGNVEVERQVESGRREKLAVIGAGGYFGEIGLLHGVPRTATVHAGAAGATVLGIGRDLFTHMVAEHDLVSSEIARMAQRRVTVNQLAAAVPGLTRETMAAVSSHLERQRFAPGEIVIRQGDAADKFYVIVAGEAEVVNHHPSGDDIVLGQLGPGEYFGEIGILHNRPRTATVRAIGSADLEVLALGRDHFMAIHNAEHDSGQAIAEKALRRLVMLGGNDG